MEEQYYDQAISFKNLYKAMKRCCRNVRWKDSVVGYEANGLRNTYELQQMLLNGTYKISPYQHFTIYEPKKREIVATRMKDRQFQMSLCESGLYDDVVEHFVRDNPACQKYKGTDFTLNRMTKHLRRYYIENGIDGWVLKCDIHHFFPSTQHPVAYGAMEDRVCDPRVLREVGRVIDSFDEGMGLGCQISQLVELAVLDDLDHFIKERLHIKHYLRYMDDFILIHPDKAHLQFCLEQIREHLQNIGLQLNAKTSLYPLRQGVFMMKWHFYLKPSGKIIQRLDASKYNHERRRMRKLYAKEVRGEVPPGTTGKSLEAFMSNADRGDTFNKRTQMYHYFYQLKGENHHE